MVAGEGLKFLELAANCTALVVCHGWCTVPGNRLEEAAVPFLLRWPCAVGFDRWKALL